MRGAGRAPRDPSPLVNFIIALAKLAAAVAVTATVVYTDLNVFVAGIGIVVIAIVLGPLFCFFAAYGLVYDLDLPVSEAALIVGPILLVWSVVAGRSIIQLATR